jgi:hypothetical protein
MIKLGVRLILIIFYSIFFSSICFLVNPIKSTLLGQPQPSQPDRFNSVEFAQPD